MTKPMPGFTTIMRLARRLCLTFWPQSGLAKRIAWQNFVTAGLSACQFGNYAEAEKQFGLALTAAEEFGERDPRLAMSLNNLARLYWLQGDRCRAEQFQTRALKMFEEIWPTQDYTPNLNVMRARFNLSRLYHDGHSFDEAERLLRKVLAGVMHALSRWGVEVAEVFSRLAAIYLDRGKLGEAETFSRQALWCWERILGSDHPDVAERLAELASIYKVQGRHDEAEALYKRERKILANISSLGDSHSTAVCADVAGFYDAKGNYAERESLAEKELFYRKRTHGSSHLEIVDSLEHVARLYLSRWWHMDEWKIKESETLRRQALEIQEKILGPDRPEIAERLDNLAVVYSQYQKSVRDIPLFQRALVIRERALGPKHPDVARSLHNVANQYSERETIDADGGTQEAERFPVIRRALSIREEAFGPDHPEVAESLASLVSLYECNGRFDKAEPLLERVLTILQKCLPPEHPSVVWGLSALAHFYKRFEKPSKAEPAFRSVLTLLEKFLGPEHSDVATCLESLAEVCHSQNNLAEALLLYERALAIRETPDFVAPPFQSRDLGNNLVQIARLYREQGKINEAEKVFQRAMTQDYGPDMLKDPDVLKDLADLYQAGE